MIAAAVPGPGIPVLLAVLLGVLQGLTEFLPVSSSGHLVIAQAILGVPQPGIALEVVLHAGTLAAVLVAYRRDLLAILRGIARAFPGRSCHDAIARANAREAWLIVLATIPAAVAGVLWKDRIEAAFEEPWLVAALLVATGVLLLATRFARTRRPEVGTGAALLMGAMQAVSLLPGISRSGATISGGLFAGTVPVRAVRFSFLMSIPAVLGSIVLEGPQVVRAAGGASGWSYAAAFATALIAGIFAIRALVWLAGRGRFHLFGFYCLAVGALSWWWLAAR